MNVLSGAPFGYRYLRKTPESAARHEIIEHEAALVAEMFRRYADDGATIADLARWLTSQGIPTRTGKHRWDRSVIWGMLRNPAYAGRAVFGKTQVIHAQPGAEPHRPAARTHHAAAGQDGRPAAGGMDRDRGPGDRGSGHLRPGAAATGRQQAVRHPRQQGPVPAAGPGRLRGLRLRLLPRPHDHHGGQQDLLLPVPGQRQLPVRRRPGLRQQAGPRRLPRPGRVGAHHRPARRPGPDPDRDRQAPGAGPHLRPGHPAARPRSSSPWPRQAPRSLPWSRRSPSSWSPSTSCAPRCRSCAPAKPACAASSTRSMPRPPTATPTSSSPTTSKASSPACAAAPPPPTVEDRRRVLRLLVKDVLIGPENITIRHRIPVREPAGSGGGHHDTTDTEGDMRKVINCVGGVMSPLMANVYLH